MFGKKYPQALVVGAGPVGLFAALNLARRGVPVEIVEKEERRAGHSYALALHPGSLVLFEKIGLLVPILEEGYRIRRIGIYDQRQQRAAIDVRALRDDYAFIVVMQQNRLEAILEKALMSYGVKVQWNHRIDHLVLHEDHVDVTKNRLDIETLGYIVMRTEKVVKRSHKMHVPWLIGADGHASYVRNALEIDFPNAGPTQHFAVFEFKTDANLQDEMRLDFVGRTANVLWPLPDGYCRWSFELLDYEASEASREKERFELQLGAEKFAILDRAHLQNFLQERAPWFNGSIDDIRWRLVVRFEKRLASAFGKGCAWLAGDAAHLTGPAGIQSMNVGLREAFELTEALVMILQKGESPELLDLYNRERLAEWRFLLGLTDGLEADKRTDPWITEHRHLLLQCLPASGNDLAGMAQQLGLRFKHKR